MGSFVPTFGGQNVLTLFATRAPTLESKNAFGTTFDVWDTGTFLWQEAQTMLGFQLVEGDMQKGSYY